MMYDTYKERGNQPRVDLAAVLEIFGRRERGGQEIEMVRHLALYSNIS
jgi:hypothetical protein